MKKIYKLKLTGGESITLTQEDYDKVVEHIGKKAFVKVSGAIFNTAYIVSITPDIDIDAFDTPRIVEKKIFEGHIDEKRGVFVVTKDQVVREEIPRPTIE